MADLEPGADGDTPISDGVDWSNLVSWQRNSGYNAVMNHGDLLRECRYLLHSVSQNVQTFITWTHGVSSSSASSVSDGV